MLRIIINPFSPVKLWDITARDSQSRLKSVTISYNRFIEKLRIYQEALELVSQIYLLTRKYPILTKDYSLCDQIRRAAISIVANIAEGYMRPQKQFKNYLKIASGSSNEVVALLQVITTVYGIKTIQLQESFRTLGRKINALSRTF
ncbi:four helix bundle protein [Candidatus Curtissbacteria bacterium]|nr:four helix bundle protein [Candidatus Curtissbacteria bacterium]